MGVVGVDMDMDTDMGAGDGDKTETDVAEDFVNASVSLNIQSLKSPIKDEKVLKGKKAVGAEGHCVFCGSKGIIVEKFSRRGYGSRENNMEYFVNAETRIGGDGVGQFI
jgi:hypothetical protein